MHVPYHSYTNESQGYEDSHVVHTGQFFFQEEFYQQITDLEPYTRDQHRRVHNEEDHDFQQDPTAVLEISNAGDSLGSGVIGTITAIVDPSATPTPVPMMDPSQMKHMDSDNFDDDEFNDDDEFDRGHGHKHAGHEHERKHQHGHGQAKQNTDMGPINIIRYTVFRCCILCPCQFSISQRTQHVQLRAWVHMHGACTAVASCHGNATCAHETAVLTRVKGACKFSLQRRPGREDLQAQH